MYPLKFKPLFVEKIWGGRKIETVLGKGLPAGAMVGESWELYDFPPGVVGGAEGWVSAQIANGPLAGQTLHEVIEEHGRAIMGDVALLGPGQFPILIKFLDARENLSVQVHPDLAYTQGHPGTYLKTEAWYVVQADEGAKLYKGLRAGMTREQLQDACATGKVEELIKAVKVKKDQCFFLPSGTVHALGAGIFAAEVQTPSDTTFRLFDFNRLDPATGKPRKLHVEEALDCMNFAGDERPQPRSHVGGLFTTVTRLVSCPYFTMEKVRFVEGVEEAVPYDEPVVWIMLSGQAQISVKGMREAVTMSVGETVLLPADMDTPVIKTLSDCAWLEVTFPTKP